MTTISNLIDLITESNVPCIDAGRLEFKTSGTGYLYYPLVKQDAPLYTFRDMNGRRGFYMKLVMIDGDEVIETGLLCHGRYDNYSIVACSCMDTLYPDCALNYGGDRFADRLKILLQGMTIDNWDQKEYDDVKRGTKEGEKMLWWGDVPTERAFKMVQ